MGTTLPIGFAGSCHMWMYIDARADNLTYHKVCMQTRVVFAGCLTRADDCDYMQCSAICTKLGICVGMLHNF